MKLALWATALVGLAIVVAAGCGPSQAQGPRPAPTTEAATTRSSPSDAASRATATDSAATATSTPDEPQTCPATFAAAATTNRCNATLHCEYPEGQCNCAYAVPCHGGAAMPPPPKTPPPPPPLVWRCTPTPPAVRADGCPGVQPSESSKCTSNGKQCSYSGACFSGATAVCMNGQWAIMQGPPPP